MTKPRSKGHSANLKVCEDILQTYVRKYQKHLDAVCREFESEVPAAEEMLDCMVCSSEQFSFYVH